MRRSVPALALAFALAGTPLAALLCGHQCARAHSAEGRDRATAASGCHPTAGPMPVAGHIRATHTCDHDGASAPAVTNRVVTPRDHGSGPAQAFLAATTFGRSFLGNSRCTSGPPGAAIHHARVSVHGFVLRV